MVFSRDGTLATVMVPVGRRLTEDMNHEARRQRSPEPGGTTCYSVCHAKRLPADFHFFGNRNDLSGRGDLSGQADPPVGAVRRKTGSVRVRYQGCLGLPWT